MSQYTTSVQPIRLRLAIPPPTCAIDDYWSGDESLARFNPLDVFRPPRRILRLD